MASKRRSNERDPDTRRTEVGVLFDQAQPDRRSATREAVANITRSFRTKASSRDERQEFFLPVTGFAWFYPEEVSIIDHPTFQRLGRVNQLGQSNLVYRGATHKRLEHVLGAVHVVQRMISAVRHNQSKLLHKGIAAPPELSLAETRFVRLGALLHDIGHLAAGHTLEDELGLVSPHDGDRRLELLFNMHPREFGSLQILTLAETIDREYNFLVPVGIKEHVSAAQVVLALIRKPGASEGASAEFIKSMEKAVALIKKTSEIRLQVCSNMIGNTICADILDYIYRDWYHVGKPRAFDERLLQYMEIRNPERVKQQANGTSHSVTKHDEPKAADEFVISLGTQERVRSDAVSAILALLEDRYDLAETVLFHRTKLAAAAMLDRALFEIWGERTAEDEILKHVLMCSDEQLIDRCRDLALSEHQTAASARRRELSVAITNLQRIQNRELFGGLCTFQINSFGSDGLNAVQMLFGGEGYTSRKCAENRSWALRVFEQDMRLPRGSLAMYCAQAKPKIAQVMIAYRDRIEKFDDYEANEAKRAKPHQLLSGGHLDAQKVRFSNLWRLHFFIDKNVREALSEARLTAVKEALADLVLGVGEPAKLENRARLWAAHSVVTGGAWEGRKVVAPVAARSGGNSDPRETTYPSGAPCVRTFIEGGLSDDEDQQ